MTLACGIDFGTSNSSVGICDAEGARLLSIQRDATSVPTALFFSFDDDSTTFGHEALDRYFAREPGRYLRAIKSVLGACADYHSSWLKAQTASGLTERNVALLRPIARFMWPLRP